MKVKLLKVSVLAAMVAVSSNVLAEESNSEAAAGSGPNPFSDCGIGAALFPSVSWAAVTSNVIWDFGTTGLTSATASPETCSGKNIAAAIFINDTYESLAEETAKGEGEHLTTLLNIFECGNNKQAVISTLRSDMGESLSSSAYDAKSHTEKASSYYDMAKSASRECSA